MSRLQTGLLSTALVAVLGSLLYPPHAVSLPNGMVKRLGYGWIFSPPRYGSLEGSVEVGLLAVQILGVVVLTGLAYLIAGNVASDKGPRPKWTERPRLVAQMQAYAAKARKPAEIAALFAVVALVTGVAKELGPSLLRLVAPESSESLNKALDRAAATMRSGLPRDVDEVTRLVDVRSSPGGRLTYFHEVSRAILRSFHPEQFDARLGTSVKARVCRNSETRALVGKGATLSYVYRDSGGAEMARFDITEQGCRVLDRLLGVWRCKSIGSAEHHMLVRYADDGRVEYTYMADKKGKASAEEVPTRWYLTNELSIKEYWFDENLPAPHSPYKIVHLSDSLLSWRPIDDAPDYTWFECERYKK